MKTNFENIGGIVDFLSGNQSEIDNIRERMRVLR